MRAYGAHVERPVPVEVRGPGRGSAWETVEADPAILRQRRQLNGIAYVAGRPPAPPVCPACTAGKHSTHMPDLANTCVGCACPWRPRT